MTEFFAVMYVSARGDGYAGVMPTLFRSLDEAQAAIREEVEASDDPEAFDFYIESVNTPE